MGLVRLVLAAVLLVSAAAKLLSGRAGRDALRSYGIRSSGLRAALWGGVIAAEAALAVLVAVGVPGAAEATTVVLCVFASAQIAAILSGRAGAPCGCFGARSRLGWSGVARTLLLAAAFAVLPVLPDTEPSTDAWLGIGLAVALVAVAVLAVGVLALARELGELRMAVAPQAALSLEHEGPELGGRLALIDRFEGRAPLALAVFTSPGCAICHALDPSLRLLAKDPEIELLLFDEEQDAEAWRSAAVPGSPYAVALASDGEALAKGNFNTLYQLESLVAEATRLMRV